MDVYFPDDEYQTLCIFDDEPVTPETINALIVDGLEALDLADKDVLNLIQFRDAAEVEVVSELLLGTLKPAPAIILVCVRSHFTPQGKERPVDWQVETLARRGLLTEAEAKGLGVFYRNIYPNRDIANSLRVAVSIPDGYLPMSCLFLGKSNQNEAGLQRRLETKFKRNSGGADWWSAGL
ncbi:MAG: hypothetical protein GXY37_07010 [Chloroflexi bacterium]|nr:hypothetical protein [Chloroflexota bacterium]